MASIVDTGSLFEIDMELDGLLEEIQEQVESGGEPSEDLVARFQQFCEAHGEKVDRIGRFVRMMEAANSIAGANQHGSVTELGCCRQSRTNQEYGALLPSEPRPQKDRRQSVHVARTEEQSGLSANY